MKTLLGFMFFALSLCAQGAESGMPLAEADVDVFDRQSVQRGAGYFVNYCLGCHSIKHLRYSRIAQDLEVKEEDMRKEWMPEGAKFHESLLTAMEADDGRQWFGVAPPDLSLIARARGADWLYSYLKGFYLDPSRPTGVNNVIFDGVGMPNVLWELQGSQKPVYQKQGGSNVIIRLDQVEEGKLSPKAFDQAMLDLVNFLVYAAEPAQYQRLRLGKYVIFALIILAVIFYKLKKEYWKDID